jgi:hypothetical protein
MTPLTRDWKPRIAASYSVRNHSNSARTFAVDVARSALSTGVAVCVDVAVSFPAVVGAAVCGADDRGGLCVDASVPSSRLPKHPPRRLVCASAKAARTRRRVEDIASYRGVAAN